MYYVYVKKSGAWSLWAEVETRSQAESELERIHETEVGVNARITTREMEGVAR